MHRLGASGGSALLGLAVATGLAAQEPNAPPRRLTPRETGCDSARSSAAGPVYPADSVDRPVVARRLPIEDMPIRIREVLTGRTVFRFVVEPVSQLVYQIFTYHSDGRLQRPR